MCTREDYFTHEYALVCLENLFETMIVIRYGYMAIFNNKWEIDSLLSI